MPGNAVGQMQVPDYVAFRKAPAYTPRNMTAVDTTHTPNLHGIPWANPSITLAFDRALASIGDDERTVVFDRLTVRRFDVDGRMHVEACNISKANVCPYFGREIPNYQLLGLEANKIYQLYRDPDELARAAPSFQRLQLMMLHTVVNADQPKMLVTCGTIGSDVAFDSPYLKSSIAVWTKEAIKLIESEKQAALSCSYRYRADMTPGHSPEGVAYDGVMRDIMGNHVALVEKGRAGPDVVVSDSQPVELPKMPFKRPNLLALTIAAMVSPPSEEKQLALDAALEASTAADCGPDAMDGYEDDPEKPGQKRKKVAKDATPPTLAPGKALDEAISVAITAGGFISKTDATKLANDAANTAVARVNALHTAREDVKPLVGIVAMDSAEDVYAFALKKEGVALDGVPSGAYRALVEQVKARKTASSSAAAPVKFASDAAHAAQAALPSLGRISVA
jgi:hypothetical protein